MFEISFISKLRRFKPFKTISPCLSSIISSILFGISKIISSVLNGLCKIGDADVGTFTQIGYRAGDAEDTVVRTGREFETVKGLTHQLLTVAVERTVLRYELSADVCVADRVDAGIAAELDGSRAVLRASLTAASVRPTTSKAGRPCESEHSTSTS